MEPLRCIHFADLHLGVEAGGRPNPSTGLNQRIHDVCDRLDELCATAEQEAVHLVVFAGDAFKHQHPTPTLQSLFASRMRRLARAGARVFLLVGNHDLPRMASLSHPFSIYGALEVEGVVVGERAEVYRLQLGPGAPAPAVQVAALPHFSRHQVAARLGRELEQQDVNEAVHAAVRRLEAAADPALPCVFAGHCHVNQATLSDAQNLFGASELEITLSSLGTAFPYYALGHVHASQVLRPEPFTAYSGSLERVDFGEGEKVRVDGAGVRRSPAEPKGFYRFDLVPGDGGWRLDAEPSFRAVRARDFVSLRTASPDGHDPNETVEQAVARAREAGVSFTDAFVKVSVRLASTDRTRLQHRRLRAVLPEAYDVRVFADAPEDAGAVRDPRFAVRMTETEALERYVETRQDWAEDRPELVRLGRELIEEVLR